jgi:hypothetical protein
MQAASIDCRYHKLQFDDYDVGGGCDDDGRHRRRRRCSRGQDGRNRFARRRPNHRNQRVLFFQWRLKHPRLPKGQAAPKMWRVVILRPGVVPHQFYNTTTILLLSVLDREVLVIERLLTPRTALIVGSVAFIVEPCKTFRTLMGHYRICSSL